MTATYSRVFQDRVDDQSTFDGKVWFKTYFNNSMKFKVFVN
jgi:hypothetical protein